MAKVSDSLRMKIAKGERAAETKSSPHKRKRVVEKGGAPAAGVSKRPPAMPMADDAGSKATPVIIRAEPADAAVSLPGDAGSGRAGKSRGKRAPARRPPRQTFLVAATLNDAVGTVSVGVYAVMTRTPAEALSAARDFLGADAPVGLTGKLSGRMAKALDLRPGEVRRL